MSAATHDYYVSCRDLSVLMYGNGDSQPSTEKLVHSGSDIREVFDGITVGIDRLTLSAEHQGIDTIGDQGYRRIAEDGIRNRGVADALFERAESGRYEPASRRRSRSSGKSKRDSDGLRGMLDHGVRDSARSDWHALFGRQVAKRRIGQDELVGYEHALLRRSKPGKDRAATDPVARNQDHLNGG